MLRTYAGLVILAWLAAPAWASAGMVPYTGKGGIGHHTGNRHGFEGNALIHHVAENVFDNLPGTRRESVESRWDTKYGNERSDDEKPNYSDRSDQGTGLYDNFPIQSFDSVNGRSNGLNPWWGMPSAGEPILNELSRRP
ncbi:MAG TPA: hypothetical protein VLE46_09090 [Nitrospira sp.]|nr:hypothetical protein [Nitrospira sp.]